MESAGARLKRIRLEKGLTLEEAHKKTKIHLNILRSIEEDNLVNFNPVYIKGFLKIYGNFLGADTSQLMPASKETPFAKKITDKKDIKVSIIKSAPLNLGSSRTKVKIKTVLIFASLVFLLTGLFYLGKAISSRRNAKAASANLPILLPERKGDETVQVLNKRVRLSAKPKSVSKNVSGQIQKNISSGVKLSMHAKEDCWVQIKVDGRFVGRNVLKKGKTETWQAKEKIEFSLNNAGAVDLEVNNKPVLSLGRRNQAINNALINKEGLINIPR